MNKNKIIATTIITLIFLSTFTTLASAATPRTAYFQSGLNYLSSSNRFYQTDSVTASELSFFKANGINSVSIRIIWKSVLADPNVIPNYKRLLTVADQVGMKVQFDFWTSEGTRPEFLTCINDIIRDPSIKQKWLSFVGNTMNELKGFKCIESWTMMNEPYLGKPTDATLFYQLWSQQRTLMKSIDSRPITIRFALGSSPWSGTFSRTQVFKACDYIAINEYLDPSNTNPSYTIYGSTWRMFNKCVSDCKNYGKPLLISEFGSKIGTDEEKRIWYEKSLALFRNKGIPVAFAFAWQTTNPTAEPFNIAGPTPAFNELKEATSIRVRTYWTWW